jgi:hypothetical protein
MKKIILLFTLLTTLSAFAQPKEVATYLRNHLNQGNFQGNFNRLALCSVDVNLRPRDNYFDVAITIKDFSGKNLASYLVKDSGYIDGYGDCPQIKKHVGNLVHIKNYPFEGACLAEVGKAHDSEIVIKDRRGRVDIIIANGDQTQMAKCSVVRSIMKGSSL